MLTKLENLKIILIKMGKFNQFSEKITFNIYHRYNKLKNKLIDIFIINI
jgi:hypothetical protein